MTQAGTQVQHTPGPWTLEEADGELWINAEDAVATVPPSLLATDGSDDYYITDEDRANARLIAAAPDLLAACEATLPLLCEFEGQSYGIFLGGDPRRFLPDEESNTPEEIAAWRAACVEWNESRGVDRGPGCQTFGDGSVYDGTGFGMGTTTLTCPEADALRAAIAKARGGVA